MAFDLVGLAEEMKKLLIENEKLETKLQQIREYCEDAKNDELSERVANDILSILEE